MPPGTVEGTLLGGRYRVMERLGTGGMAAVYLAHDERLGRPVALKRMHTAGGGGEMDARRFEREAKLGASLSHPNLVSIFDTHSDEEGVLLVMEYVEGETLGDLLARGRVSPKRALTIVRAVAEALDHAHRNGIVHRDIKPGNVLLGADGSVKLADLGIAKAVERTEITGTGTVLGTPAYMAPEQLEGRNVGPAVDVYALATVAFEMLTGRKARQGRSAVEIAHQVVNGEPPDARALNPDLPPAAVEALRCGMAKDPARRPRSATAFADQLEHAFQRARPVAPAPPPAPTRSRPRVVRTQPVPGTRWLLPLIGLVALVGVAIALATSGGGSDGAKSPPKAEKPAKAKKRAAAAIPVPSGRGGSTQAHSLHARAYALVQQGDYASAVPLERQALAAFPTGTTWQTDIQYAYALFNLGHALRMSGRAEDAIPVLRARLAIPDQTATVRQELGLALRDAGN